MFCLKTELTLLIQLLFVWGIRNWNGTSAPWPRRYTGAIHLEVRAPSLTKSLGFKQLRNKVVFINTVVHRAITAVPFLCDVGGDVSLLNIYVFDL